MYTIIDSDNYAATGIEPIFFPGGEPHIKIPASLSGNLLVFLKLRTWNDVGLATCLLHALGDHNYPTEAVKIFIPYFPAARQDKIRRIQESDPYSPLTIAITGQLLTGWDWNTTAFDIHSQESFEWAQIDANLMPADLPIEVTCDVVGVIAPDEGAKTRAESFRKAFYPHAALVQCSKRRDPTTGRLSGYHMPPLVETGRYIIVDDICDGGGTFNLLAEEFIKDRYGSKSALEMFVSHGIFSKGLGALSPIIEKITTTDSWCQRRESYRLIVLPLRTLFDKIMGASANA